MAFELSKDETVPAGVRRVACERIDQALAVLGRSKRAASDRAVHEARKRFKEIRGALRLVREELGGKAFRKENRTFRDAGRPLSAARDAKVLVDTLDGLVAHFNGRVTSDVVAGLRRALERRRRAVRREVLVRDGAVTAVKKEIRDARARVRKWPLKRAGWKAIQGGLKKIYRDGRRAMTAACAEGADDDAYHEWRKRSKDLRYGLEMLQPMWPETIEPLAEQAHRLTNLLGEEHDLCVLRAALGEELGKQAAVDQELLRALIDERRGALRAEARELGEKMFAESEQDFVARIEGYWRAWREAPGAGAAAAEDAAAGAGVDSTGLQ